MSTVGVIWTPDSKEGRREREANARRMNRLSSSFFSQSSFFPHSDGEKEVLCVFFHSFFPSGGLPLLIYRPRCCKTTGEEEEEEEQVVLGKWKAPCFPPPPQIRRRPQREQQRNPRFPMGERQIKKGTGRLFFVESMSRFRYWRGFFNQIFFNRTIFNLTQFTRISRKKTDSGMFSLAPLALPRCRFHSSPSPPSNGDCPIFLFSLWPTPS